ncbi:MAG: DegT/DnrJ/EryC1/StrS family aminotransferase [Candidatus Woesearchaeota archaeon]|nr:DegT/DnrJ/EryC1/StrS family aminotransferase [Candidatus Woesearchaeota archaeon]
MIKTIPLSKPFIGKEEMRAVQDVLKSGQLSSGPKSIEFEKMFASLIGVKYAAAVNSGTAGLHLCIKALGLKEGDEVITSPFSFIASANSVVYEGAKPVFVDIDEKSLNMEPDKIEEKITKNTKAILAVHIFGQPCEMDKIMNIAKKHNLAVIEDACEAICAEYKGRKVGTFGVASIFAFYPNKQITTGEGGMICTNDKNLYELLKSLRNQGRKEGSGWLSHEFIGYNYRLTEMSAALGVEQLKKINKIIKMREAVAEKYAASLKGAKGVTLLDEIKDTKRSWFVYVIRLDKNIDRKKVIEHLKAEGISTNIYLPPIHLQPIYKKMFGCKEGDFPICERVSSSTLALPFYTQMKDEEIDYVCEKLKIAIGKSG